MFDINLFGCDFFLLQFNLCVHHLIAVCLFAMPFWSISYDAISSGRWSHRNFALRTSESKPTIVLHACCLHESTMSRSLNYLAVRENAVEKRVPNCVWCIGWWSRRRWNVWVSFSCHQRNVANAQSFAQCFFFLVALFLLRIRFGTAAARSTFFVWCVRIAAYWADRTLSHTSCVFVRRVIFIGNDTGTRHMSYAINQYCWLALRDGPRRRLTMISWWWLTAMSTVPGMFWCEFVHFGFICIRCFEQQFDFDL